MNEKEGKSKKGFMSRLSSFRKKKSSSSKHGGKPSYKTDEDNMLGDPDEKARTSSNVSSSQNSLEGLNGRARSTSDLIAGYEKRLSVLKDEKERASTKGGLDLKPSSSQDSDRQANVTPGSVIVNPGAKEYVKSDKQTVIQSMTKGGFMPYQSIFTEEEKMKGNKAILATLGDVKTDDTTQTDFSQLAEEDDIARLVRVQSTRTPETRRAHIPHGGLSTNLKDQTYHSYQSRSKETFIGPDSPSPVRGVGNTKPQFQSTSTPMPKSIETSAEPTSSPIVSSYSNSMPTPVPGQNDVWQLHGEREIPISHLQSKGDHKGIDSNTQNKSTHISVQGEGDTGNAKQKSQLEKTSLSSRKDSREKSSTFVLSSGSEKHTFTTTNQNGQSGTPRSGNRTITIEKGKKTVADRTFSLESSGANSVCSDDLMCDSRFAGGDESVTFEESHHTQTMPLAITGHERSKSGNRWRRDSEEDSVSSSLPLSSSVISGAGRVKLSVADRDSYIMVDAVTYNNMVKEIGAMRLMLLKLSTLLHEEKVVKTRSSEVQCELPREKLDQDTQTDQTSDGWKSKSEVSIASIQCNIHPEKQSRASQYEKPKELPKPSRLTAPTSKLAKPRVSQPAGKEDGSTETGPPSEMREAVAPLSAPFSLVKQDTEDGGRDCSDVSEGINQDGEEPSEEKGDDHKMVDENILVEEGEIKHMDLEVKMENSSSEDLMKIIKDCERKVEQTTLNQTVVLSSSATEGSKQIENKEKMSPKRSGLSPGHSNPGSPQKTSKLQQFKAKPSAGVGSKIAKPSGSLRPPQRSKLESKIQSTLESEQYTYTKSKSQQVEMSVSPPESPKRSNQVPTKNKSKVEISNNPSKEGLLTESVTQKKQLKYQNSKVQKQQKTVSQSKLTPPSRYSQDIPKRISQKSLESLVSDSSEGKEDENNGNTSTEGVDENVLNGNQQSIPGSKTSNPSKLPKSRSGSRLPRGRGIPRMTTR